MKDAFSLAHSSAGKHWHPIGVRPHHGIAIPLFSLHSMHSYGIGEFTDLHMLIDWCASLGFDVIQLLPLNDTDGDISPYNAISAFALNPIFLGLASLPYLNDYPFLKQELKALPKFSSQPLVHYAQVREHKEHFLRHYFKQVGPELMKSDAFTSFMHETRFWLKEYAVFKILKKRHHKMSWETWLDRKVTQHPTSLTLLFSRKKNLTGFVFAISL